MQDPGATVVRGQEEWEEAREEEWEVPGKQEGNGGSQG